MLTRAKARRRLLPHRLLPPGARAAGGRDARLRLPAQPRHRPGQHDARAGSGSSGPLWFNDPAWAKPSLVMLGLWGIGNMMIIFLAAVLDVPRHLYESAELDGAGACRRLRWVTLPTISPVILFAVVLGVIQGLQYFTQAFVAASVAAGQASQGGSRQHARARLPGGLDALLPGAPLLPRLPLLQHGLRLGDGDAAARRRIRRDALIIRGTRRWRALPGTTR